MTTFLHLDSQNQTAEDAYHIDNYLYHFEVYSRFMLLLSIIIMVFEILTSLIRLLSDHGSRTAKPGRISCTSSMPLVVLLLLLLLPSTAMCWHLRCSGQRYILNLQTLNKTAETKITASLLPLQLTQLLAVVEILAGAAASIWLTEFQVLRFQHPRQHTLEAITRKATSSRAKFYGLFGPSGQRWSAIVRNPKA